MSGFDLNASPTEVDDIDMDPPFCTQAPPAEMVEESPDPIGSDHEVGGGSNDHSGRGPHNNTDSRNVGNNSIPTTTMPTESTTYPEFEDGEDDIAGMHEVLSTPTEPFLGMRFDTVEAARVHYNAYAAKLGFTVKSHTSQRNRHTGTLEKQQFVCNKFRKPKTDDELQRERMNIIEEVSPVQMDEENSEGHDEDDEAGASKRSSSRLAVKRKRETIKQTSCHARMFVKLINNKWEVTYFIAEHNHAMVDKPSLTKYLRSHKGRMMEIMSEFYGEDAFVPYGPKTISNLRSEFRSENKEYDISETLDYFKDLKQKDPDFFYDFSLDDESRVEHIFWVDSVARKAYEESYHDCVSFDTTFLTNRFSMPFAPFVGINRHGQSYMLGCGLIRDEKQESFEWLFRTFLKAMHGTQPSNIIIDQDWAMRSAIQAIFPETWHRNCRWHIMKKANEKLGSFLGRRPGLAEEFNSCVDESWTVEEFEARWQEMVLKWELAGNETFAWLKKNAHTWVPCYFKDRFFPFLQSTQRSEGFNAVLKRYIHPHNSIKHFVKQYEKIQRKILGVEGNNDYRTEQLEVVPQTTFPIEKHALSVYTRDIYHRFKVEFELIGRYNVQVLAPNMYYLVPNSERCYPYGERSYMVNASGENSYNCDCCKFQRDGLLCCHVLKVFTHIGIDRIPERYITRRWTQLAVESVTMPTGPALDELMPEQSRQKLRYANLCTSFVQVAKLGSETEQAEAIARRHIREMKAEFVQLKKVRRKRAKSNTSTNAAHPTVPTSAHQHTTDPNAPQHTPRANAHQHTASRNAPQPTPRPNAHQQTADRSGQ
ncbi:protein FAR1-RELATED SEQUENCE 5-like [Lolium perenne]|uniref:protein FAR1-RELATED SEQUENCE 5-like n=1 Tax=Lolium perenne TaxID=4522 RepID=UPI0021F53050|nr:protein FAR1-RELATED SEQUENCE 5-like [Lolium perenne]